MNCDRYHRTQGTAGGCTRRPRIKQRRRKYSAALQRHILASRAVLFLNISHYQRSRTVVIIELIPAKDAGVRRELMVQAAHEEILPNNAFRRADKFPNVQVFACGAVLEDLAVGIRIILEEGNYSRAWRHSVGSVRTTTIDGAAGAKP